MSDFRKLRMTAKGRELLALAHQGVELQLLNIVVGNGAWPQENQEGDPPAALVSQKKIITVSAIEQSGEVAQVRGMLTNTSMTQGFAITEIGVTALHPVDGEILYMADYCELAKSSYIPDNSGAPVEIPLSLDVLVASSQEVTLQIDDRFFSATKQDIDDHDAEPETHQPLVDRLHVSTPLITSPTPGAVDVIETPTFQCAAFESHFVGVAHSHSQWQVDTAAGDWTSPIHDSGADAVKLTAYTLPSGILVVSSTYKVRVRYKCEPDGLWSEWSDPVAFTTRDVFTYVAAPTNQSPGSGATDIGETPTLQASTFQVVGGSDSHFESEFRILQGGSVVHTSTGLDTVISYNVPQGVLAENTSYIWQCRYRGTSLGWGEWSVATGFTTMLAFVVGDEAVTYDPALAVDYVASKDLDTSTGTATVDGGQGFFDTEFQGQGEGDWSKASVESDVRDPDEMTVDGSSTTSSLVLTSNKTGLLADGDKVLINDGTGGVGLAEVILGSVTPLSIGSTPLALWRLDGGLADEMGGSSAIEIGTLPYVPGLAGQAVQLTGSNALDIPAALQDWRAGRTIVFWMQAPPASYYCICTVTTGVSSWMSLMVFSDGTTYVRDGILQNYSVSLTTPPVNPFDGNWHMVAYAWDGTIATPFRMHVDDQVSSVQAVANWPSGQLPDADLSFGRDYQGTFHALGVVDQVMVFDGMLSQAQINDLYAQQGVLYGYTCTSLSPVLAAVPDKVFLPAPLYFAHGDGTRILRPDTLARYASEVDLDLENVKGPMAQFVVDTADTSGHFDAAKGSKVLPGCRIVLSGGGEIIATGITGDGTALDSVAFTGTAALGAHNVLAVHGVEVDAGIKVVRRDLLGGGCSILLHSDTTDGSTTFEDLSGNGTTFSAMAGSPNHATAQKKFGASSIYFAGGEVLEASLNLGGTADFTLETWVYFTGSVTNVCFIGQDWASNDGSCSNVLATNASGYWYSTHLNGYWTITAGSGPSLNTWHHVALVRSGDTVTLYVNGNSVGSGTASGSDGSVGGLQFGGNLNHRDNAVRSSFSGYLDEIRLDNGIARYQGNFTSPTGTYAVSACPAGEYYTAVIGKAAVGLANVTDINSASVAETVGGTTDKAFYSLCFNDHTYRVWTGSVWRDIASDAAAVHGGTDGTWRYRDNADAWAAAYADNAPAAVSQAVAAGANNQMTGAMLAGIADATWPDVSSAEVLKVAVALYTSDAAAVPEVESVDFDCDFAAGTMGDFALASLADASWIDDAGTLVVTEVSEEIEPTNTFRGVAMGLTQLPSGAQISTPKINTWKQGA
jgi:hypothetical protein